MMSRALDSQSMTLTEYAKYVMEIITRLHSENTLSLKETITPDGKTGFALEFRSPEWFRELSEEIQETAFDNLRRIMMERVSSLANHRVCVKEGEECDCCEHISKRARY